MDIDGVIIIGGLDLARSMKNEKFFMLSSTTKHASQQSLGLPREYREAGLLVQAGHIGGLNSYILIDMTLRQLCGRMKR